MNAHTTKTKEMGITRFSIKGYRWFQKSYGNTYHTTYISALIDGVWCDLGSTPMEYGYGEQYLCTAGKWLIDNGFIENLKDAQQLIGDGYQFNQYTFRQVNNIDNSVQDVNRKKDL